MLCAAGLLSLLKRGEERKEERETNSHVLGLLLIGNAVSSHLLCALRLLSKGLLIIKDDLMSNKIGF